MAILTLAMTFLVIAFVSALTTGKYPISLADLCAGEPMAVRTFTILRLPRALMGLVGGFGLGVAGFVYQTAVHHGLRVCRRTSRSLSVPWTHRPFPSKGTLFHCSRGDRGPRPGADISHGAEAHG